MHTRLSICRRKRRYPVKAAATAAARAATIRLLPYRCDRCGAFHLTSRTRGKWRPLDRSGESGGTGPVGPPAADG